MHIVSACFPHPPDFLKHESKLKARRGRNPKSSKVVKRGKKINIGGNITEITHTVVWYIPSIINEMRMGGEEILVKRKVSFGFSHKKKDIIQPEGALAP